ARFNQATRRATWADLFWVQRQDQLWPMGADTGGRLTRMQATTIHTLGHTAVGIIMLDMVIIMARRITTPPLGLTDGKRLLMGPTVRRHGALDTILTPGLMPGAVQYPRRMELAVPHKPIIRTPARTLKRDKTRAPLLSGAAPTCHGETRVLRWVITQLRTAR